MKQITPQEFLLGVESGEIDWKGTIGRRVYGVSRLNCAIEKPFFKVIWADVP